MAVVQLRRAGALALVAGAVFLVGATLYQGLVLVPAGYLSATAPISGAHQQFAPFLLWANAHRPLDAGLRIIEALTFVLALWLPGALGRLLWPADRTWFRRAVAIGRAGVIAFLVQIALTAIATPLLAARYVGQPASQASTLRTYIAFFAGETVLASVVGGGLLAIFLTLVSLRGSASGRLPGWLAYLGLATAGLLGVSAVFALTAPTQPETPTSAFAFLGLSLWFVTIGVLLLSVQVRHVVPGGFDAPGAEDRAATSADSAPGS